MSASSSRWGVIFAWLISVLTWRFQLLASLLRLNSLHPSRITGAQSDYRSQAFGAALLVHHRSWSSRSRRAGELTWLRSAASYRPESMYASRQGPDFGRPSRFLYCTSLVRPISYLASVNDDRALTLTLRRLVPVRPLGHLLSLCYELDLHQDYCFLDSGGPLAPELLDKLRTFCFVLVQDRL